MKRTRRQPTLLVSLLLLPMLMGIFPSFAEGQEVLSIKERADALAGEATQLWDRKAFPEAIGKFRESLALDPRGETYRDLGDLYSERDMHEEAIAAYGKAISMGRSPDPELRQSLGEQLLWADRPAEAIPLLESAVADRPREIEAKRHLALAYRMNDRLEDAEIVYREILRGNSSDADARKGLAVSLLWQGRFRAATAEFELVLSGQPSDADALLGLSRARFFLDLPEEAEAYAARAADSAPEDREIREQVERVRERRVRSLGFEARGSNDSDELTIVDLTLSAHARPREGLDIDGSVRKLFLRQGSPGKTGNLNGADSVDGSGGSLLLTTRTSAAMKWHAGAGITHYDIADFHPWSARFGIVATPVDTLQFSLDWERSHFDSILSLQNNVTADTVSLTASKHFLWKTEISASAALVRHHNKNDSGQERENRGERLGLEMTRRLYLRGDVVRIGGIIRFTRLGFSHDLDVGVFDPRRYTTEEAGVEWQWQFRPLWQFHGTLTGGAQQESGGNGGPMYSVDLGLDGKVGHGRVSFGAFSSDSNARGKGEGFRRLGGLLSFLIPF